MLKFDCFQISKPFQLKKIKDDGGSFQFEFHVGKLFRVVLEYGKVKFHHPPMLLTISVRTNRCEPYSQTHFEEIKNYAKHFLEAQKSMISHLSCYLYTLRN